MEIILVEPYNTGSHAEWGLGYARHSAHVVRTLSLSGSHWKWRMHGGAVTLARKFQESGHAPDLILATDMLDLAAFLSLTRAKTSRVPAAVYFHENQLTYAWSPADRDPRENRDEHYGFINFTSALVSDRVFFNSHYHMEAFLSELPRFLAKFPDHQELGAVEGIGDKASVLPLGFEFARLDPLTLKDPSDDKTEPGRRPLVLWNHRWEYDKNPEDFFRALRVLAARGLDFDVALLGESFDAIPACFAEAEAELGDRIVQFGYVEDRAEYARWLRRADLLPVTSNQEFFGASVIEAVFCGCFPILPNRLAYPELFPPELRSACFYRDFDDLVQRLAAAITQIDRVRKISFRSVAERFDWRRVAPMYDASFADIGLRPTA
jgi:glycosyltransferase involved in cell wall biosynthesis